MKALTTRCLRESIDGIQLNHEFIGLHSVLALASVLVRLTRKLAHIVDGIDLSDRHVGDIINLPQQEAWVLIAEGWAERAEPRGRRVVRSHAGDAPRRRKRRR